MPSFVLRLRGGLEMAAPQALGAAEPAVFVPEMVGRNCHLGKYKKRRIEPVRLPSGTKIIAYASPDSTYAVTKKLLDGARRAILIGIYDFSAPHMREILLAAMARGVKVSLMLDIDSKTEQALFDDLVEMGVRGVSAPSCANSAVHIFSSSHEKVIVIDDEWCLVQSGNYSSNSIPLNETDGGGTPFRTGNRDTGLALRSPELCALFTSILESDMAIADSVPEMLQRPPEEDVFWVERAPRGPSKRFKSKTFPLEEELEVTPVLSPDNYMEVVPDILAGARRSVLIEQQYIRATQPQVAKLMEAIAAAKKRAPDLDVRIVLGKVFDPRDLVKEQKMLDHLAQTYGLEIGRNVRYINTDEFVHCHNKMVVVDGEGLLVSSQNWSDSAVSKNREAGLFLRHEGLAGYFTAIFEHDWKTASQTLPQAAGAPEMLAPQSLSAGGYLRVEKADYQEV